MLAHHFRSEKCQLDCVTFLLYSIDSFDLNPPDLVLPQAIIQIVFTTKFSSEHALISTSFYLICKVC